MYLGINMYLFNESFFGESNNSMFRLLVGSFTDPQFATVLFNMNERVAEKLQELNISIDQTGDYVEDFLEELDIGGLNEFSAYAFNAHFNTFNQYINNLLGRCEWMNLPIFSTVLNTILGLSHIENTLLLIQKHSEKPLTDVSALSMQELAHEAITNATIASQLIEIEIKQGVSPKINKTDFLKSVVSSVALLSYREIKVYSKESFDLFAAVNELFTELAVNYKSISSKTKPVQLSYSLNPKYNAAYSHLNDNTDIGNIELPVPAFTMLPYPNYNNDGDLRQTVLAKISLPDQVDLNTVLNAINYTLTSHCECEHDCCGCSNESYYASSIKGDFIKLSRAVTRNI